MSFSSAPPGAPRRGVRLSVESLEDRTVPTFLTPEISGPLAGQITFNGVTQRSGGLSIAAGDVLPDNALNVVGTPGIPVVPLAENEYVLGTGPGVAATVGIFSPRGELRGMFQPFGAFSGGINVAVGDVLGDGANEIIVSVATRGLPVVAVYNPQGQLLSGFLAFSPLYTGGVNIAVGNVADGVGAGGYHTRFTNFAGIVGLQGSIDYKEEIIIGTATQSSRVLVTDGGGAVKRDFFALDPAYTGGVTVAAGTVDKSRDPNYQFILGVDDTNAYDEIVVGTAAVAPLVSIYSAWEGGITLEQRYFAFDPGIRQGINVAAGSSNGLRGAEIYASLIGTSLVRTFDGITQEVLGQTFVYPPQFSRVANLATGDFTATGGYVPYDDFLYQLLVQAAIFPPPPFFLEGGNPDFVNMDLAVVAGDGPFQQGPRFFTGAFLSPAPFNGP